MTSASDTPRLTAIVVSHNTREDLRRCLASLRAHSGIPCRIVVVDNASELGGTTVLHNINDPRHYADLLLRELRHRH